MLLDSLLRTIGLIHFLLLLLLFDTRNHILFKELGIKKARNEHPVLFTVPVHWNKLELERLTQEAFENLNVPGLYIAPQPLLALYGCGAVTGVVVDIGHNTTGNKKKPRHGWEREY